MTVRSLEDVPPLERIGLVDMSYSRLDTLDFCEAKFYFSYAAMLSGEFSMYAAHGNVIHSVLEECLNDEGELKSVDFMDEYEKQLQRYDPYGEIPYGMVQDGKAMLEEFIDLHNGVPFTLQSKEEEFGIVIGRGYFRGYIDRVDKSGHTIKVIDYKSGKREVAKKRIPENLQLGIYALAMRHKYPKHKIYAELYYLRSGRRKGHLFTREDLDRAERELEEKVNDLITKKNFRYTPNKYICKFCDFSKSGACSVGVKRVNGEY